MKWLKSTDAEIDELLKNNDYVGALSKIISKNVKEDYLHPTETSPELLVIMETAFEKVYFNSGPLQDIQTSQLKMMFANLGYPELYDELVQRAEDWRREEMEAEMRADSAVEEAAEEREREDREREREEEERRWTSVREHEEEK
jgi:hypothetical protein